MLRPAYKSAWNQWLALGLADEASHRLRLATITGRPCGSADFATSLEQQLERTLTPRKRGPKPNLSSADKEQMELFR